MSDDPRDHAPLGSGGLIALAGLAAGGVAVVLMWHGRGQISEHDKITAAIKTYEVIVSALAVGFGWRSLRSSSLSDMTRSWRGKFATACIVIGAIGIFFAAWMTFVTTAR